MASKVSDILDQVGSLSVLELVELVKALEEKFGVSAAAPTVAVAAGGGDTSAAAEEKTEFKVTLKDIGAEKIKVIKALRSVTSLSLGDAKSAAEDTPYVVADAASKEDAEKMKKALEDAGAKVDLS